MFFFCVFLSSVVEPITVRVRESTGASLGQALFKKQNSTGSRISRNELGISSKAVEESSGMPSMEFLGDFFFSFRTV